MPRTRHGSPSLRMQTCMKRHLKFSHKILLVAAILWKMFSFAFAAVTLGTIGIYIAFTLAFLAVALTTKRLPAAVLGGVAGSYSNIGYMGPPLVLSFLGSAADAPVAAQPS